MYPKINVKRPIPYSVVIIFTSVDARVKESHIMIVPDITLWCYKYGQKQPECSHPVNSKSYAQNLIVLVFLNTDHHNITEMLLKVA
jgi:hypothetical protein